MATLRPIIARAPARAARPQASSDRIRREPRRGMRHTLSRWARRPPPRGHDVCSRASPARPQAAQAALAHRRPEPPSCLVPQAGDATTTGRQAAGAPRAQQMLWRLSRSASDVLPGPARPRRSPLFVLAASRLPREPLRPGEPRRENAVYRTVTLRYEPVVQRTYADLARHYGTGVVPARPGKSLDKARWKWQCNSFSAGSSRACATRRSFRSSG